MTAPGAFAVGDVLTAGDMNDLGVMSTITVTATNFAGTVAARGYVFNKIAFVEIKATASGAATGIITFTLPAGFEIATTDLVIGNLLMADDSAGLNYNGVVARGGTNLTLAPRVFDNGAAYTRYTRWAVVNATVPFTWANNDVLSMNLCYRVA
jgi:hypothetical protein